MQYKYNNVNTKAVRENYKQIQYKYKCELETQDETDEACWNQLNFAAWGLLCNTNTTMSIQKL